MWFADHPVATAAIVAGILVVAATVYLVLRGLALWREVKAARRQVGERMEALQAAVAQVEEGMAALDRDRADLEAAMAALQPRLAVAKLLARTAGEAAAVAKSPLKYVGR